MKNFHWTKMAAADAVGTCWETLGLDDPAIQIDSTQIEALFCKKVRTALPPTPPLSSARPPACLPYAAAAASAAPPLHHFAAPLLCAGFSS